LSDGAVRLPEPDHPGSAHFFFPPEKIRFFPLDRAIAAQAAFAPAASAIIQITVIADEIIAYAFGTSGALHGGNHSI